MIDRALRSMGEHGEVSYDTLASIRQTLARHLRDAAPDDVEVDDDGRVLGPLDRSDLGRPIEKRKKSLSPL